MDKFLQNNTVMKLIAFAIAVMLWMIVTLEQDPGNNVRQIEDRQIIDERVEAIYDEEEYAIIEMDENVQIFLQGRRALLNLVSLRQEPYTVYVDLTDYSEGTHYVPVRHSGFPTELDVSIIPREIRVVLERKEARTFPVEIEVTGKPEEGFTVQPYEVVPDQVQIIGPVSLLDEVARVRGFVNINGATDTIVQDIALKIYDQNGSQMNLEVSPGTVSVTVPIESPVKSVPVSINWLNELPEGISLVSYALSDSNVNVYGTLDVLDTIEEVVIDVDLSDITESQEIEVEIPVDDDWRAVEPATIVLEIEVGTTRERLFSDMTIRFDGLEDGLVARFVNPAEGTVQISAYGSQELIDELRRGDITVIGDLSGLGEGRHRVTIIVDGPPFISVSPDQFEATVEIVDAEAEEAMAEETDEDEADD